MNEMRQVVAYKHTGVATTRTTYDDGSIDIQYHSTVVARRTAEGTVIINPGGWYTQTTKKRINDALDEWAHGWRVYQKDFQWYLANWKEGHEVTFSGKPEIKDMGNYWIINRHSMSSSFPKVAVNEG